MKRAIFITCLLMQVFAIIDIMKYGAVPHSDSVKDQFKNQEAINQALLAANASGIERIVRIPAKTFYSMPFKIQNMHNIKIQIFGRLAASKNVKFWPRQPNSKRHLNFIQIDNCTNIQISGGGKIDGRGYHWWMILLLNSKKYINNQDDRPHLINILNGQYIKIHDIILKNSPQFHLKMDHCHDVQIYNMNIKVNTTAQINLLKRFSLEGMLVMFPFNTDGIDPSGGRMHIYNLTVQNWDDVVVPKPSRDFDCTRDMLIQNIQVVLGVGMSIGSVPPNPGGNCIRNITFKDVTMKRPFKGIYVKTNPGDKGHGNVSDIYYKNFTMDRPIWWAIYIGPQQMRQPDGSGPGCMLYPFDKKGTCETQSRVSLNNITLQNIKIHKSLLYPITIRCNVSNPCTQINFINVHVDQWQIGQKINGYVCQFASGRGVNNSPNISCLNDQDDDKTNLVSQQQSGVTEKGNEYSTQFDGQTSMLTEKGNEQNKQFDGSVLSYLQDIRRTKSIKQMFEEMVMLTRSSYQQQKHVLLKLMKEVQRAAVQVGYHDEDDDQFMWDVSQLQRQFQDKRTLQQMLSQQIPRDQ